MYGRAERAEVAAQQELPDELLAQIAVLIGTRQRCALQPSPPLTGATAR